MLTNHAMECWYDWLPAWAWQPPRPYPVLDCQREMQAFQGNCISLMSHGKRELTMRRFRPQVVAESSESIPLQAKRKNPALRRLVLQPSMGGWHNFLQNCEGE